ncbi:nucleotidyltransferase family protein [Clostridium sp. FP2]|uniref:nucleotidyltransferase family protein n=1 Tax=Clostridium sp. FP2 TaxID=2724481 RepID=UPI0013E90F29|nr:nucleotidyltransferase family protein [Clostridium sp. FP2]MBZ9621442.1 nucleotidyltransferase family protein [Clostridium sp. FP2]
MNLLNGYNLNLSTQLKVLEDIIQSNKTLNEVIERANSLGIENYYIGAGCIAQTVWNYLSNNPLNYGISDIDFVYFDDSNLEVAEEEKVIRAVNALYSDQKIKIDVKNQARVHLWYEERFGNPMEPYVSLEYAINTWPTTATAVGVRREENGDFKVYAPFGLNDLFGKIVRANKTKITEDIYNIKVVKWLSKWSDLKIISWSE